MSMDKNRKFPCPPNTNMKYAPYAVEQVTWMEVGLVLEEPNGVSNVIKWCQIVIVTVVNNVQSVRGKVSLKDDPLDLCKT